MTRWRIATLVSIAVAISYLDRQTLPVAIQAIGRDIPMTNEQFSLLQSAFLLAYAVMYVGGGWLVDRVGTRRGLLLMMVLWSLASAAHSLATTVAALAVCRLLLGAAEGGSFPAATRTTAEWFPVGERSSAMGLINAGTAIGMILAPPLIAAILAVANWRWTFPVTAMAGLTWAAWWYRDRAVAERADGLRASPTLATSLRSAAPPWSDLLRRRETWGLVGAKFLSDAGWFFLLFWLPKYLYAARGFDVKAIVAFGWIPPAAAGLGCVAGGFLSSWLLMRTHSIDRARKIALGASAAVMPSMLLVPHAPIGWVVVLFSVAYFGQQSWSTLVMTLPTDLFPTNAVGSVAGLIGFGGALGGVAFGEVVGYLLDHGYGYGLVFAMAASLHVSAFALLLLSVRKMRPGVPAPLQPGLSLECVA